MVNLTFRDERFSLAFQEGSVGGKMGIIDSYGVTNLDIELGMLIFFNANFFPLT